MEYLETIMNVLGWASGGGLLVFATWQFAKRKAAAEAKHAEAEAKKAEAEAKEAEVSMAQKVQDTYQQMIDDKNKVIDELRKDRDYYKKDADDIRQQLDNLAKKTREWKRETDGIIDDLSRKVARNVRQIKAMCPLMCGDVKCKKRMPVTVDGILGETQKTEQEPKDIAPLDMKDM